MSASTDAISPPPNPWTMSVNSPCRRRLKIVSVSVTALVVSWNKDRNRSIQVNHCGRPRATTVKENLQVRLLLWGERPCWSTVYVATFLLHRDLSIRLVPTHPKIRHSCVTVACGTILELCWPYDPRCFSQRYFLP